MLTSYRRQFYHDRRRIGVAALLALAVGALGGGILPDPFPAASTPLLGLGLVALIPVFTARLKSRRHWVEIFIVAGLIAVLSGRMVALGVFGWHDRAFLFLVQAPAIVVLLFGLWALVHGGWSDRSAWRPAHLVEATLHSRAPLEALWYGFVPTPGFGDHNPDRDVVSIEFADADRRSVRLTTWTPPRAGSGEVLLNVAEITALKHVRFHVEITRGAHDPCLEGETEMVFEDRGASRTVHLRHKTTGLTRRRAALASFDDTFGRMMTARLAAIETRAATGRAAKAETGFTDGLAIRAGKAPRRDPRHSRRTRAPAPATGGYRTAYDRRPTPEETRALQALGRI